MGIKHKVLNLNTVSFLEEHYEDFPSTNFDVYLNTKIWDATSSRDILSNSRNDSLLYTPSKIDIDYKIGKFDIQLSLDAWKRINAIEEEPIDEDAILSFKNRVKKFYEK